MQETSTSMTYIALERRKWASWPAKKEWRTSWVLAESRSRKDSVWLRISWEGTSNILNPNRKNKLTTMQISILTISGRWISLISNLKMFLRGSTILPLMLNKSLKDRLLTTEGRRFLISLSKIPHKLLKNLLEERIKEMIKMNTRLKVTKKYKNLKAEKKMNLKKN